MGKYSDEKLLTTVNETNIFYRIKTFFLTLFRKKEMTKNEPKIANIENNEIQSSNKQKEVFLESIRNVENEEVKLLKLQQQYDDKLIETKDLPRDKIKALINLYKKQINELSENNARRKEKLLLKTNKQ